MSPEEKKNDLHKRIEKKYGKLTEEERIKQFEPFFGILKDSKIDPLKLQKKWRGEW